MDLETQIAQGGRHADAETGAIVPPIQPSTTFARDDDYELIGSYVYGRYSSPTIELVQDLVAQLEGAEGALAFSSGLAAATAIFETVPAGTQIVAPTVIYHGTLEWLRRISAKRGIGLSLFDAREPGSLEAAIAAGPTALVWIETPANPMWDVVDIAASAAAAHDVGAILAVDGTVAPPVTTRALEHGADLVFHSATKYLNGHSDVGAGVVATARDTDRWEEIATVRRLSGGVLGAFEAWLLLRGMRTLHLRYRRASENALAIAQYLESHPAVAEVMYPGLASHPGHEIATRQMTGGFSGMLSFLVDGDKAAAKRVASSVEVFTRATSLGGAESLIEHRGATEPPESLVPPNLIRLSVGIEAVADLIADLDHALLQR